MRIKLKSLHEEAFKKKSILSQCSGTPAEMVAAVTLNVTRLKINPI